MHLVIDMQGAQVERGGTEVRRSILSLVKALVRMAGEHRVTLVLNGLFPSAVRHIKVALAGVLSEEHIRVWRAIGPTSEDSLDNKLRREVAERLHEAFIATLRPDVVLVTGCFEGFDNNAVFSATLLGASVPTIALLFAPLPQPGAVASLQPAFCAQAWHRRRLALLAQCRLVFADSKSSRREMVAALSPDGNDVQVCPAGVEPFFQDLGLSAHEKLKLGAPHGIHKPFLYQPGGTARHAAQLVHAFAALGPELAGQYQLAFGASLAPGEIAELRTAAAAAGLQADALCFTAEVAEGELLNLYNACVLCVFPAPFAAFQRSMLEAMACGAPVLAGDTACTREFFGSDLGLFDPADVGASSAKLREALTDKAYRARLSAQGKEQAAANAPDPGASRIWGASLGMGGASRGPASALVNVDRTGIFRKRHLKILVTKLDHLGDFILSIPAMAKLRAKYPDALIDIVVGSWNAGISRDLNLFRQVFSFDFFKRKSSEKAVANDRELAALLQSLDSYDMAIDLRRQPDSRFLLVRTRADLKVGYQTLDEELDEQLDIMLRAYKEGAYIRTPLNKTPISMQILRLIDALPGNANDFISLPSICAAAAVQRGRIAIFPKAGTEAREWDPARVRQLVSRFLATPAVQEVLIFFVNKADAAQYGFAESERLKIKVGLEFSVLSPLLASSNLCIANNSGGIHLASYLGVPTIGIYSGHELSVEWGPQFHESVAIHRGATCAPCHLGRKEDCPYDNYCLGDISVDDVYRKSMEAIGSGRFDVPAPLDAAPVIGLQRSDEEIVRNLIEALSRHLDASDRSFWLDVSAVIASNHPTYMAQEEQESAHENLLNTDLDHKTERIEWLGFSSAEPAFRWTDGTTATIQFYLEDEAKVCSEGRILLLHDAYRRQHLSAKFNGIHVYDGTQAGRRMMLVIPIRNLRYGLNRLELHLPDARAPGNRDTRLLGIAVRKLRIVVEDESLSIIRRRIDRWKAARNGQSEEGA
jgi:ADP-heptose:LPS heptosyltransferase/glycosyltransferase involved in cell wall biosynthesis